MGEQYDDGTPLSAVHPTMDSFRINLKNYTANTVTAYDKNENTSAKEINTWYDGTNDGKTSSYRNYESNPYWSYINANRYDFLTREDMKKLYSSMTGTGNDYWHVTETDRIKTPLGKALLGTDTGTLSSPYGVSEYLPFDYIDPDLNNHTYSSNEAFREDNCHVIRNVASIDVSELEKNAKAGKFASWENDTRKGQVLMTYTLYGYEGYKLLKELEPIIEDTHANDQPMRKTVILSDLLPAGVNYHGSSVPVCGKLTTTNIGRTGYPINEDDVNAFAETWNTSQARIIDTKTESNWNNTGRTLVQFTVEYEDDHTNGILNSNSWYIGCGIQFKAYVSWDNYTSAAEKDNIFAFVAADDYCDGNIYGKYTGDGESQIYDDAGSIIPKMENNNPSMNYTPFQNYVDLDKDSSNTEHNRMYGHANEMDSITMARTLGIKKSVKADADLYSDYENKDSVIAGKGYTYKIHIDKTEQGIARDLVVFDKIEAVTPSTWKGTFQSVDLNEVKSEYPDAEPDIWYSESLNAPTELYRIPKNDDPQSDADDIYTFDNAETYTVADKTYEAEPTQWDFTKVNEMIGDETEEITINGTTKTVSKRWIKSTDWTKNNAEVHSVAVDFGNTLVLQGQNAVVNVYIKMTAPSYDEKYKYTFNRSSFCFQDYHRNGDDIEPSGTFEYSGSNITTVTIGQRRRVEVAKKIPLELSVNKELLEQAEFTFQVKKREFVPGKKT